MPKLIYEYGFYLPNGKFIANEHGEGHAKNAYRFFQEYSTLEERANTHIGENADDLLLMAGCAAVAGSCGNRCLRIAKDNTNPFMKELVKLYQQDGFEIHNFWQIDSELEHLLYYILNHEYASQAITEANNRNDLFQTDSE